MLKRRTFSALLFIIGGTIVLPTFAQSLRNHPTSENFKPRTVEVRPYSGTAEDGDLSNEEYHRRRLVYEGLTEVDGTVTVKALEQELLGAFQMFSGGLVGGNKREATTRSDRKAQQLAEEIRQKASYLAQMDQEIARAEARARARGEGQENFDSSTTVASAESDQDYQENLENSLKAYEDALKPLQEKAAKGTLTHTEALEMLKSLSNTPGHKDLEVPPEYKGHYAETVYTILAPFREMTEGQVRGQLEKKFKSDKALSKVENFEPRVVDLLTKTIRSERALPDVTMMLADREKLIRFLIINIVLFIIALIWRRKNRKNLVGAGPLFLAWVKRFFVLVSLKIGVFLWFFGANFKEINAVFQQVFAS